MEEKGGEKKLPRNVKVVAVTSFLTDVSSEMVINTLPLFLKNVLGVKTSIIGLIEGVAESTSSMLRLFSGWFSDRLRKEKTAGGAGLRDLGAFQAVVLFCPFLGGRGRGPLGRPHRQGGAHRPARRPGGRLHSG